MVTQSAAAAEGLACVLFHRLPGFRSAARSGAAGTAGFPLRALGRHSEPAGSAQRAAASLSLCDFRLEWAFSAVSGGECVVPQLLCLLVGGCVAGCLLPSGLRPWRGVCWGRRHSHGERGGPPEQAVWQCFPLPCSRRGHCSAGTGCPGTPGLGNAPARCRPDPCRGTATPVGEGSWGQGARSHRVPDLCGFAASQPAGDVSRRWTSCGFSWDAGLGLSPQVCPQPMLDIHLVPCGHQAPGHVWLFAFFCPTKVSELLLSVSLSVCLPIPHPPHGPVCQVSWLAGPAPAAPQQSFLW